jgi:hypothetical protein
MQDYHFTLVGAAEVSTGLGTLPTWYVRSQPLADRYATKIEAWLATEHDFLPVKIRFSSDEGISIETLAREITRY